jgi:hypothetical protein
VSLAALRVLVLRPPSSIRVATVHPSSARAITAMFRYLSLQARASVTSELLGAAYEAARPPHFLQ